MHKKTIIVDIDGTVLKHYGMGLGAQQGPSLLLDGVREQWEKWNAKGYNIIVLTGRRESMRAETVRQLEHHKLAYDQLVMGVGGGPRVLINDLKPGDDPASPNLPTAVAIQVERNKGMIGPEFDNL